MKDVKIGVIGAGTMEYGIALVAASYAFPVVMDDIKEECVTRAM